ncbi:MAG TPA: glycosyltransferase family 39 protein, partial [Abditibacterium sp.]
VLGAILLAAFALGLIYNFVILPGFGPDEPRHFAYVRLLWEEHRFPFLLPDGKEYRGAHSLHPPLYYLLLLPTYGLLSALPDAAIYHGLRLISLLLCLFSLGLIYDVAHRASGNRPTARLTTAIVAFAPIFGMTSGTVNNDSASVFAVALFCWLLSRVRDEVPSRQIVILGVVFGLGALCKATVALCDGAALLVFFWARCGWKSSHFWRAFLVAGVVAVLVMLPWYARNFAMYGKFSPIESGYSHPGLPNPSNGVLVMMMHPNFPTLFGYANWGIFYSLWSQKDWIPEAIRTPIYLALVISLLVALVGHLKLKNADETGSRPLRLALYAAFIFNWAVCAAMALFVHWGWAEGGRYLAAALLGLAFWLARGWNALVPPKISLAMWSLALLGLNAVCIYWLLFTLNPTFGPK